MKNQGGFRLTQTDVALIQKIATEGFQSYPELRMTILKNHNRQWSWDVLRRLVKHNYLRKCMGDNEKLVGWRVNSKSRKVISILPSDASSGARSPVYRSSFDHDQVLRSIRGIFIGSSAVESWTPEHVLKSEICRRYAYLGADSKREKMLAIPDALIRMRINGSKLQAALELEITQKSRKRLYRKIERYITDPEFRLTFYIAKGDKLLSLLQSVYRQVLSTSLKAKMCRNRNGIYFTTLENILANGESACFQGLNDTTTLKDLG